MIVERRSIGLSWIIFRRMESERLMVSSWSPLHSVQFHRRSFAAVILTHDHADGTVHRFDSLLHADSRCPTAVFGCDDLRVFTWRKWIQDSVPVYCDLKTFSVLSERFPCVDFLTGGQVRVLTLMGPSSIDRYLVQQGIGSGTGLRPAIDFKIITAHQKINIAGIVGALR